MVVVVVREGGPLLLLPDVPAKLGSSFPLERRCDSDAKLKVFVW